MQDHQRASCAIQDPDQERGQQILSPVIHIVTRKRVEPARKRAGQRNRAADQRGQHHEARDPSAQFFRLVQAQDRIAHPAVAEPYVQHKIQAAADMAQHEPARLGMAAQQIDAVVRQQDQRVQHQHGGKTSLFRAGANTLAHADRGQHDQQQDHADQVHLDIFPHRRLQRPHHPQTAFARRVENTRPAGRAALSRSMSIFFYYSASAAARPAKSMYFPGPPAAASAFRQAARKKARTGGGGCSVSPLHGLSGSGTGRPPLILFRLSAAPGKPSGSSRRPSRPRRRPHRRRQSRPRAPPARPIRRPPPRGSPPGRGPASPPP